MTSCAARRMTTQVVVLLLLKRMMMVAKQLPCLRQNGFGRQLGFG